MRYALYQTCALVLAFSAFASAAQRVRTVTGSVHPYVIDLPSAGWRAVVRSDGAHSHTAYVYGDGEDALLRIRMKVVDEGVTPRDLARRDRDEELRFLPGYVGCGEEGFDGRTSGVVSSYEYTDGGRPMAGRIYYLRADALTIYALHFTGPRDRLTALRGQADFIARSFHLRQANYSTGVQKQSERKQGGEE